MSPEGCRELASSKGDAGGRRQEDAYYFLVYSPFIKGLLLYLLDAHFICVYSYF